MSAGHVAFKPPPVVLEATNRWGFERTLGYLPSTGEEVEVWKVRRVLPWAERRERGSGR